MLETKDLRRTLSNAINQAEPLVYSNECLLKACHVFLHRVFHLLFAAVDRMTALIERIHTLVQCRLCLLLLDLVLVYVNGLCVPQRCSCLCHGV